MWSQVSSDPIGYGAAAFGLNTDNGLDALNFAQSVGLVDSVNSARGLLTTMAENRASRNIAAALQSQGQATAARRFAVVRRQRAGRGERTCSSAPRPIWATWRSCPGQGGAGISKFGAGLNGAQALKNIYDQWGTYEGGNLALVVRQSATAVLKTASGTILPGSDLVWDPLFNVIDHGSRNWIFENIYGGDESLLYNESGWKPSNRRPRPGPSSNNVRAHDPNAIVGPAGVTVGSQRFVARADSLPYRIEFENKATASLPATQVVITHTLDADLDATTFALGAVSFGGRTWQAPAGVRTWTTLLDDRDRSGLYVRMRARLDVPTRVVTWTFTGLDPNTMSPPVDTTRGFLPKNTTSPQGEGNVTYSVQSNSSSPTGTKIDAQASIIFDGNAPIDTNVDSVVIDAGAPSSAPSVGGSTANPVVVAIGATDDGGGSGVGLVDVYVSRDGGAYQLVRDAVDTPTFVFTGVVGSTYRFMAVPEDKVGNVGTGSLSGSVVVTAAPENPGGPSGPTEPSGPTIPGRPGIPDDRLGKFTPLTPDRLLDTRVGIGTGGGVAPIGPGATLDLTVTGLAGVPATGVSAVALNVTAVNPTSGGYLTVWPTGIARPEVSSLNFDPHETIPNAVVVKVGDGGRISIFNPFGATDVLIDVSGFWSAADGPIGSAYTAIVPTRVLDTRQPGAAGPLHSGASTTLGFAGVGAVPADATGVVLNVVAVDPTAAGYLTVWPAGAPQPNVSTHNFTRGTTIANLVFARLGADRAVEIFNESGDTQLVVDIVGYFGPTGGRMVAVEPSRVLDTRQPADGAEPIAAGAVRTIKVRGIAGVPAGATAVVANVTAVSPTAQGYFTAWASGLPQPLASNLNFAADDVVPGLSIVAIGDDGSINLLNSDGETHALVDIVAYIE